MIPYGLRKIWSPAIYQGANKKDEYFEGWYYKIVDREEKNIYAVIPGISKGQDEESSHAFIQIIDGGSCKSYYARYDTDKLKYSKKDFNIGIGENTFTLSGMKLNMNQDSIAVEGNLDFKKTVPWPSHILSPGAMGWYAFVPFMECYHGIISMNHTLTGSLNMNGEDINFDGGRGYLEKDWGRSFPDSWIWAQSNHFQDPDVSLSLSIVEIHWCGKKFTGFITGLWINGRLYRFTTYTGVKLKEIRIYYNRIYITFSDKHFELKVEIVKSNAGVLASPKNGLMSGKIYESISSEVSFCLYEIKNGRKSRVYEGMGRNTGLEIMGCIENLISSKRQ